MNSKKITERINSCDEIQITAQNQLNEAVKEISNKLNSIEYQRNNIQESKRDNMKPPEGQYPGYDNQVNINHVLTIKNVSYAVGDLNAQNIRFENTIWKEDGVRNENTIWDEKQEIINKSNILLKRYQNIDMCQSLDEKEELLQDALELIERTVNLFETAEEKRQV